MKDRQKQDERLTGGRRGQTRRTAMPRLTLRIDFDAGRAVGPGKIKLMELIDKHGSISEAGRQMGMSYRRAWLLVDSLNRCFRAPVPGKGRLSTRLQPSALLKTAARARLRECGTRRPSSRKWTRRTSGRRRRSQALRPKNRST